jgi:hypothetical protein
MENCACVCASACLSVGLSVCPPPRPPLPSSLSLCVVCVCVCVCVRARARELLNQSALVEAQQQRSELTERVITLTNKLQVLLASVLLVCC